jgi:anti-sigma B factor antagonist
MSCRVTHHGPVVVLAPSGHLDGRAALRFERDAIEVLDGGARFVIVDCSEVSLLAGAGLRVLLFLSRSLDARNGRLALCGVGRPLRNVLHVAELSRQFVIVPSVDEAMAQMPVSTDESMAKLASRVHRVLESRTGRKTHVTPAPWSPEIHALAARVSTLLTIRR